MLCVFPRLKKAGGKKESLKPNVNCGAEGTRRQYQTKATSLQTDSISARKLIPLQLPFFGTIWYDVATTEQLYFNKDC